MTAGLCSVQFEVDANMQETVRHTCAAAKMDGHSIRIGATMLLVLPVILPSVLIPLGFLIFVPWGVILAVTFGKWPHGSKRFILVSIGIRSMVFSVVTALLWIGWIRLFGTGQLGAGESLLFEGTLITWLGYWTILENSGQIGFLAGVWALVVLIVLGRGTDRAAIHSSDP